jgi:hypothetical protein
MIAADPLECVDASLERGADALGRGHEGLERGDDLGRDFRPYRAFSFASRLASCARAVDA